MKKTLSVAFIWFTAAFNGNRPFSIILNKKAAASFEFKLTPVEGTKDVPVIQNIKMHRT